MHEKPVALIDDVEKKATIIQINNVAQGAGVRCGMTSSQGLARCLELVVKTRQRAQEKNVQEILLHFAGTLTPYVEATSTGIVTVQFTDFRNIRGKMMRVIDHLADAEILGLAGIASTPDTSFLAAHLGDPVLQVDHIQEFLAALPLETLARVGG